ncbi:MAG TPA: 4-hydroxy-tetrahydrodipicolinate reductase [Methanoculleus sp.]|jgi:4-hydroxy-tetrahydrodipicolinate reductase|uniref:4-hydroxy-tetrahydrodipicolinate reductase n=1 Tax=Methanoculleus sp. TaxID=90427 RepID=UPI000B0CB07D|nr:4-hydroxy-tetrahydrodipicolinate reductase [Methanoculleus sp.]MBP7145500.1 4-hydroxy-tetrahydrodipicolinate reductase [Methanoculleus sp.]HNQ32231.1 4-hydroxy-tetrahydrodipicolinate reductase [Methanoculleus sp.]HNT07679.1 4-hydroxy-tetrahydrodipicolinate reductase [Methanoculleus sp.]HNV38590.1 4-hydroxy-tetrahydrodipicolinate reductase [Methanoculleus sp.]HOC84831.1 4-hydroxy-tetrahydrodipicolinate reductase [Methanoculleus sp.]
MIKVAVSGALGRMGANIGRLVNEAPDLTLVGGIDVREGTLFETEVVPAAKIDEFLKEKRPDVLVDFTVAAAAVENVRAAARNGVALVVGTTGFSPEQREVIRGAVEGNVPAVISSNFSVGVNIFWKLVREAARELGDYDIEVTEAHHRHKKDAPSGTAKTILDILDEEIGNREKAYGRVGMTERKNEIGVHVIRGGDIVGDHAVLFAGNFECIEISHRAYDRAVFAQGAVRAVRWVVGKEPRMYTMQDVLGI